MASDVLEQVELWLDRDLEEIPSGGFVEQDVIWTTALISGLADKLAEKTAECEKLIEIDETWTGCGTGDCPHKSAQECTDALVKVNYQTIRENELLRDKIDAANTELATAEKRGAKLSDGLSSLAKSADAYMTYHREKFFKGSMSEPTGLTPAIEESWSILSRYQRTNKEASKT